LDDANPFDRQLFHQHMLGGTSVKILRNIVAVRCWIKKTQNMSIVEHAANSQSMPPYRNSAGHVHPRKIDGRIYAANRGHGKPYLHETPATLQRTLTPVAP
jgi:hypothetical protein